MKCHVCEYYTRCGEPTEDDDGWCPHFYPDIYTEVAHPEEFKKLFEK